MGRFVFTVFCCLTIVSEGHESLMNALPTEDQRVLERFFQTLLSGYEFGYTLFGSKPMSVALTYRPSELSPEYTILEKGWEAWDRCQGRFPSFRFFLKKDVLNGGELSLTIFNKLAASQVINENLELFQSVFGKYDPETILQKICDSGESIFEMNNPHIQSILGILLGYGGKNALNFQREVEVVHELVQRIKPPFFVQAESLSPLVQLYLMSYGNREQPLKRTESTTILLNEMNEIIDKRNSFDLSGTSFFLERFLSPRFACWEENLETAQLKRSYERTRSILSKAYSNGPFLEVTLRQWVSPEGQK